MEITNNVKHSSNALEVTKENKQKTDYTSLGEKGQIIEGVVSDVSDRVLLDFGGIGLSVEKSSVKNAKEGEVRKFEIMEVSAQSIVLKEIGQGLETKGQQIKCSQTMVENQGERFAEILEKSGNTKQEEEKEEENLDSVKNRLTAKDVLALEAEFMSLEKYNLERLDKVLTRIKKERLDEKQHIEAVNEKTRQQKETMKQIALHNVVGAMSGSLMNSRIEECLEQYGLPVTKENVDMISNAMTMASVAPDLSEHAMSYMVDQQLPPTIDNLYHAQYAGAKKTNITGMANQILKYATPEVSYTFSGKEQSISKEDWEKLEMQVKQMVADAGLQESPKIMERAQWLFENQLPITKESLLQLEQLYEVKENYDADSTLTDVVKGFVLGELPKDTLLWKKRQEVSNQKIEVFLAELDTAWKELNQTGELKTKDFAKKRQIEEIRLKMTLEAANRMEAKGISLDLSSMEQVVEELRMMEEEYYTGLLKEQQVEVTPERIQCLRDATDSVMELRQAPMYVLGESLGEKDVISLLELRKHAGETKQILEQAGERYEALMTKPRTDLGDSMKKAFANIDGMLEDLQLEPTVANERAVKILAHNQMEINTENIYAMKEYDARVNRFIKDLHPAVTVELIKRNINPLDTPIVELNEEILAIKEEIGVTGEEKYSKYLWQLERREGISSEERKMYIGMYRLLNNIQKSDGAAVGYVLNTKREITLNNLLSAITSLKREAMDIQMDEQSGFTQLKYTREPLVLQVKESFAQPEKQQEDAFKYFNLLTDEAIEHMSPSRLEKLVANPKGDGKSWDGLMEKTLEQFAEALQSQEEEQELEYREEMVKDIQKVAQDSKQYISYLQSCEMPVTVENILAVKNLFSKESLFRQVRDRFSKGNKVELHKFEQALGDLAECLEDKDTMQEGYRVLEEKIEAMVNAECAKEQVSSMDIRQLKNFLCGIQVTKELGKRECYEIPVVAGEQITNIHLTILHDKKNRGSVQIQMDSQQYGMVRAEFSVKNHILDGMVLCDSVKSADKMREENKDFIERIREQGMETGRITYGLKAGRMDAYSAQGPEEEKQEQTPDLYQLAKAFVKHVSYLEQRM